MSNGLTDEQIIAALISTDTIGAAADSLQVSRQCIYNRMSSGQFQALYQSARADILRTAVHSLNTNLQQAIETTAAIMQAPDTNAATRLQAARIIIDNACRFIERLAAVELQNKEQARDSMFEL